MMAILGIIKYHQFYPLTHWGRLAHIWVSNLNIIGSDNGLLPGQCQALIWTNTGIFRNIPQRNFNINSNILIHEKPLIVSSAKWWPFCLGLSVLSQILSVPVYIFIPIVIVSPNSPGLMSCVCSWWDKTKSAFSWLQLPVPLVTTKVARFKSFIVSTAPHKWPYYYDKE